MVLGLSFLLYDDYLNRIAYDWSVDTLKINNKVNREMFRACKRFHWCTEEWRTNNATR